MAGRPAIWSPPRATTASPRRSRRRRVRSATSSTATPSSPTRRRRLLQNTAGNFVAPGGEGGADGPGGRRVQGRRSARLDHGPEGRRGLPDRDLHLDAVLQEAGAAQRRGPAQLRRLGARPTARRWPTAGLHPAAGGGGGEGHRPDPEHRVGWRPSSDAEPRCRSGDAAPQSARRLFASSDEAPHGKHHPTRAGGQRVRRSPSRPRPASRLFHRGFSALAMACAAGIIVLVVAIVWEIARQALPAMAAQGSGFLSAASGTPAPTSSASCRRSGARSTARSWRC